MNMQQFTQSRALRPLFTTLQYIYLDLGPSDLGEISVHRIGHVGRRFVIGKRLYTFMYEYNMPTERKS